MLGWNRLRAHRRQCGSVSREPADPPIVFAPLEARAEGAFVSNAAGAPAATGRGGGGRGRRREGGRGGGGPCLWTGQLEPSLPVWQAAEKFPSALITPSFFPSSPFLVPLLFFLPLLFAAGCRCAGEILMGRADSADKQVSRLASTRTHTHTHTIEKHTPFLFLHFLLLNPRACSCTGATHTGLL